MTKNIPLFLQNFPMNGRGCPRFFTVVSHRACLIKGILSAILYIALYGGTISLRPCLAAGDMESVSTAISEHLACYPLEMMSIENQKLSGTSKNFCLTTVYHQIGLHPFWVTSAGPSHKALIILDFLKKAGTDGLDPKNYETNQISALLTATEPRQLAELDTLLTFNLIKYIEDVSQGRIKPYDAEPALFAKVYDIRFDPSTATEKALNAPDLAVYLASLPPAHQHYANLKKALMTYRAMEKNGGWPSIAAGKAIRPGDNDHRLPDVIRRLSVTGDLYPRAAETTHYSPMLKNSIIKFQLRHGLGPDGVIGPNTLAAMNVPVSGRIKQIMINMTRWRWQKHDLGKKYILVNIANFDLTAFENGQEFFEMPVIVGKFQNQTPIFSDRITQITLNPYWNIPPSIAQNEELPNLQKDPNYLEKQHVRLFAGWSADAREIDSKYVDWKNMSPAGMDQFKLRQDPGAWNALGQIKFDFPNQYDIYLHDTAAQNLFSRTQRDFSHGCIRVSDPIKLAAFVLSSQAGGWTPEKIMNSIKENKNTPIRLSQPMPIYITYQTAWVDKNGMICFKDDIYGMDKELLKALYNE